MRIYDATFRGRLKNNIGINFTIHTRVHGNSREEARLSLHDTYENINYLVLMDVTDKVKGDSNDQSNVRPSS